MTTRLRITATCSQCGEDSEHIMIGSTSYFGRPDLDLRPPRLARSTIDCWVQECPHCRFVSPDIEEAEPGATEVMAGEAWARILQDSPPLPSRPRGRVLSRDGLMNAFQRRVLLDQHAGHHKTAAQRALHAAWAADDIEAQNLARDRRREAAALFESILAADTGFTAEERPNIALVLCDVLRRAGDWTAAGVRCDELSSYGDPTLIPIAAFERRLIDARDDDAHSLDEIAGEGADR
jgi:hypothetical protein